MGGCQNASGLWKYRETTRVILCGIQLEIFLRDFFLFSRCCKSDLRGAGSFDSCAFSPAILSVGMCAAGIMQA